MITETAVKRRNWFTLLLVLAIGVLLLIGIQLFLARSRTQRNAMGGLNQCGPSAIERLGMAECLPAFSFDGRGPAFIEDVTGPKYFGRVTDVYFRSSDDKQVIESLPHSKQLDQLGRVMFTQIPSESVIAKYRELLPNVKLVDGKGVPIP